MSALQPKFFSAKSAPLPSSTATGFNANHNDEIDLVPTCPSSVDLPFPWTAGIMRVRWFAKVHHVTNQWRYHVGACWSKPVLAPQHCEVQRQCVNKSLSVVQLRGSLTGSEFPSRTHLHHKKWNSLGACAVAFKRHHRPANEASWRPNKAIISQGHVVLTIKVLEKPCA